MWRSVVFQVLWQYFETEVVCQYFSKLVLYNLSAFISFQGLTHFDEILQESDGIVFSRGNLGIDLPPEKVH